MADFELARGLMQLSSLSEQRRIKKDEERFRKAYTEPYMEAQTTYLNALATKTADQELTDLQKEQARETGFRADKLKLVLNEIAKLDPKSPLRTQAIFGIRDTQNMANEIALMRARLQEQSLRLQESQVLMGQSEKRTKLLFEDSAEGAAVRGFMSERGILNDVMVDAIEGTFDITVPGEIEKEGWGIFKRINALLDSTSRPTAPGMRPAEPRRKALPAAKPKPAPKKAPEKKGISTKQIIPKLDEFLGVVEEAPEKEAGAITMAEIAPILEKAEANDVNRLDIYKGIQKLTQEFPKLERDDILMAYALLAEGVTIDELIEHLRRKEEE